MGLTFLHMVCMDENVTDEMLRYAGGLWPDAAKEKTDVRATLAAPGERALATRDASLSLSLASSADWQHASGFVLQRGGDELKQREHVASTCSFLRVHKVWRTSHKPPI